MKRLVACALVAGAVLVMVGCGAGTKYVYVSDIPSKARSSNGNRISGFSVSDLREDKSLIARFSGAVDLASTGEIYPALIRNRYVIGDDFAQCIEQRLKSSIKCKASSAGGDAGTIFVEIRSISMDVTPVANGSGGIDVTMAYDVFHGADTNRQSNTIRTRVSAADGEAEADRLIARALAAAVDDLIAQTKTYIGRR